MFLNIEMKYIFGFIELNCLYFKDNVRRIEIRIQHKVKYYFAYITFKLLTL